MKLEQWQSVIHEQRLPHQLKLQSHQIEKTFSDHNMDTQVFGGGVSKQTIRFDLSEQLEAGKEMLSGIKKELLSMFGVSSIQFNRVNGNLQLQIERQDDSPVPLVDLISSLQEIPPRTAILGLDDERHPLLHEFSTNDLSHILVQGESGAGKSSFLRTIAVSLAMMNKQSQLQLVTISLNPEVENVLKPLDYLPHMLEPNIETFTDCQDLLLFLEDEMQYRLNQGSTTPTIVTLIDDVEYLFKYPKIVNQLQNLLQNGPTAGLHFVLAHGNLSDYPFPEMLKANMPLRIVGRVSSEEQARHVTGLIDSQANLLEGKGDFLTFVGETVDYFHGAYLNDYELHLIIDRLHRNRPRPILAQPFSVTAGSAYEAPPEFQATDNIVDFSIVGHAFSIDKMPSEDADDLNVVEEVDGLEPQVVSSSNIPEVKHYQSFVDDSEPFDDGLVEEIEEIEVVDELETAVSAPEEPEPAVDVPTTALFVRKPIIKFGTKVTNGQAKRDPTDDIIPFDLGAPPDKV